MKWIGAFLLGIVLLVLLEFLYLRETWGGAYLHTYVSPCHPEYKVEIYDFDATAFSDPYFKMYAVVSGHRQYLGDFDSDDSSEWSPWNSNLCWTNDGKIIFCHDNSCRVAYEFGQRSILVRKGLPMIDGLKTMTSVEPDFLDRLLSAHGGEHFSPFLFYEDPQTLVWRDFVPSERN